MDLLRLRLDANGWKSKLGDMGELQRLRLKATAAKERQIEAKEKARKKQKKIIVFDTHMVKRYQFRTRQRKKIKQRPSSSQKCILFRSW